MKKRNWALWALFILVVAPAILFSLYTWITLTFVFAHGERTGFVQKISEKGWLCKTWEGELAMVNLPGTAPEIFSFSVRDDSIVEKIKQSMGQRIILTYDQHRGIPTTCFGETGHFATGVSIVTNGQPVVPATTPQ